MKKLPLIVDSSGQFEWYRIDSSDITFEYFKHYTENETLGYTRFVNCCSYQLQFTDYSKLDFGVMPFIKKYFSPSEEITDIISKMERKYDIDYNNTCVLFYRGNDKNRETLLCTHDEYIGVTRKIHGVKFLIQSDETEFIEKMSGEFPGSFYFKDEIRHMKKCDDTVDLCMKETNYVFSKYYLAITIMMARCKYVIMGSGNCSLWIVYYRGNVQGVYQNLHGRWIYN